MCNQCRRVISHVLLCGLAIAMVGCQAASVGRHGREFREQVIATYNEQAMDNLIRAYNYQPFVQLKYSELYVSGTDTLDGRSDFTYTDAVHQITRVLGLSASGNRATQLSYHADPVIDRDDVYDRYMQFAHNPQLFQASVCQPNCPCHVVRCINGMYYYVPQWAAPAYFQLVMETSVKGGETPLPTMYQRRIVEVTNVRHGTKTVVATLKFDQPIPRGTATAIATLDDCRKVRLKLTPPEGQVDDNGKPVSEGSPVLELNVSWIPEADHFTELNLMGAKVNLYSDEYPPEAPTVDVGQKKVLNALDRIQANQFLFPAPR